MANEENITLIPKKPPVERKTRINYEGSIFWLIFWLIFFFPIAFVLLFIRSTFELNNSTYRFKYEGSTFWLLFWTLVFFPIAILMLFLNGCAISTTDTNY